MEIEAEDEVWLQAAEVVLSQCAVPMHYLEIKRVILEKSLVQAGCSTTLESALFKDVRRPNARFRLVDEQGTFMLMDEEEQTIHRAMFEVKEGHKMHKQNTDGSISAASPHLSAHKHMYLQHLNTRNEEINELYRRKFVRLKRFAKHMLFSNAAVCDEVSRVEDKLTRTREERRFLVKKLLSHQAVSEALVQLVSKQPNAASMHSPPGHSGSPAEVNTDLPSKAKTKRKAVPMSKKKPKLKTDEKPKPKKKPAASKTDSSGSLKHLLTSASGSQDPS